MLALFVASLLAADAGIVVLDVESRVLERDDRAGVQVRVASGVASVSAEEVVTTADLRALADVAAAQQTLDCDGSSSCLSELANAYGADVVITTRVNKVGSRYLIEVVALEANSARVLKRVDATTSKDHILDVARDLGADVVDTSEGPPVLFVTGVVTASIGVGALVVGGVGAALAEGAVRGANVSAADKNLGFQSRLPLVGVAVAGAVAAVVGVGLVVWQGAE